MKKVFIFDTYNFLFRAYYALPKFKSDDGVHIGAIYGFLNMIIKYLTQQKPDYILAACDTGTKTFRSEIYPDYKANRSGVEDELLPQFDILIEALESFDIKIFRVYGYEADDVIASCVHRLQEHDVSIRIFSSDKDLFQLKKHSNVEIYDPLKDKVISEEYIIDKFGVNSSKLLDVLSLMGDSSDNIPGVRGIGPKTASALINDCGDIESLFANLDTMKKSNKKELLYNGRDSAFLSKKLITLDDKIDLVFSLEDLQYDFLDFTTVSQFLHKYSMHSIMPRLQKNNFFNLQDNVQEFTKCTDVATIKESILNCGKVVVNLQGQKINICSEENLIYSIYDTLNAQDFLKSLFLDKSILKIIYDSKKLLHLYEVKSYVDLTIMSYCCDSVVRNFSDMLQDFCGLPVPESEEDICIICFALFYKLKQYLHKNKTFHIYHKIDAPLIDMVVHMEKKGIILDVNLLDNLAVSLDKKIKNIESRIFALVGREFLIGSVKQLGEALFIDCALPSPKRLKSGVYSTDAETLEKLSSEGYELAKLVLKWRHNTKMKNTYTVSLIKYVDSDKRLYTNLNINGTATGRMSSHSPNMQNIPVNSEIRTAFVASPDCLFLSLDYSQIEIRLLAYIADVPALKEALSQDIDIHALTASTIFNIPIQDVTEEYRRKAKGINFGIIYGITPFGLARNIGISRTEADKYISDYFDKYPGIKNYMNNARMKVKIHNYVETYYGRRCSFNRTNTNKSYKTGGNNITGFIERFAINAPLQGTAADIIKKAMVVISRYDDLRDSLVLQVHDELIFEIKKEHVDKFSHVLRNIMENISPFPLKVDIKIGTNLGNLKSK